MRNLDVGYDWKKIRAVDKGYHFVEKYFYFLKVVYSSDVSTFLLRFHGRD